MPDSLVRLAHAPRTRRSHLRRTLGGAVFGLGIALALSGCNAHATAPSGGPSATAATCSGIRVVVDFGPLGPAPIDSCVPTDATQKASEIAEDLNLVIDGTATYSTAVVCRVNDEPSASEDLQTVTGTYRETCADMPSANAYWSVWVEAGGVWKYAETGFNELTLKPGETLGLIFNLNNTVTAPAY
ncbi:MAG TPA: hypothetical protein VK139_06310 [Microbacteriaceae bacterium]|nr:hypothetical protein [Microbacteriaceae bacterium]